MSWWHCCQATAERCWIQFRPSAEKSSWSCRSLVGADFWEKLVCCTGCGEKMRQKPLVISTKIEIFLGVATVLHIWKEPAFWCSQNIAQLVGNYSQFLLSLTICTFQSECSPSDGECQFGVGPEWASPSRSNGAWTRICHLSDPDFLFKQAIKVKTLDRRAQSVKNIEWAVTRCYGSRGLHCWVTPFDTVLPISGGSKVSLFAWMCSSLSRVSSPISFGNSMRSLSLRTNWNRDNALIHLVDRFIHNNFGFCCRIPLESKPSGKLWVLSNLGSIQYHRI